jgi:tetratricopeptide (TPR) repeat protein
LIMAIAVLLFSPVDSTPHCTYQERFPPHASGAVEAVLSDAGKKKYPERKALILQALSQAQQQGDGVGEAEAYFGLAKLEFETTQRWPAQYLHDAEARCRKTGCGPELITALFSWALALGPTNPLTTQAVEEAFSIAEAEELRPMAAVDALFYGGGLLVQNPKFSELARKTLDVIIETQKKQIVDANAKHDFVREARAESSFARILTSMGETDQASELLSRASTILVDGGCGPESVSVLLEWASSESGHGPAFDRILNRALSVAEAETKRPLLTANELMLFPSWEAAPLATRSRYLAARLELVERSGSPFPEQLEDIAKDAKQLGDLDLAEKLYKQLVRSNGNGWRGVDYLHSLAEIAQQKGEIDLAKQYREQAAELEKKFPPESFRVADVGRTGGGGGGGSSTPDSTKRSSPWDPPEIPGTEGATPGAHPKN